MMYTLPKKTKQKSYSFHSNKTSTKSIKFNTNPTPSPYQLNSFPQTITELIQDFENCLENVLSVCRQRSLAAKCQNRYHNLIHQLSHFFSINDKKNQLYVNSIDMKEKLLEKLKKLNEDKSKLERKLQQTYKSMRKRIIEKDDDIRKWKELVIQLEAEKQAYQQKSMLNQQKQVEHQNELRTQKIEINFLKEKLRTIDNVMVPESQYERFLLVQAESIEKLLTSKKRSKDDEIKG